jgi:hypothetical protein
MPLLGFRNKLIYPGGSPGFDPSHPAAGNTQAGKRLVLSAAASGANMYPIYCTGGQVQSNVGTLAAKLLKIGPAVDMSSGNAQIQWQFSYDPTVTNFTVAAIFYIDSLVASTYQAILSNNAQVIGLWINNSTPQLFTYYFGGNHDLTGLTPTAGHYYFVCGSAGPSSGGIVGVDLTTGQTAYSSLGAGITSTDIFQIAVGNSGYAENMAYSHAMFSTAFLNQAQLQAWAADPWSFWYPEDDIYAEGLQGPQTVSNPFVYVDVPPISAVKRSAPGADQSLNPNLFKNPVPFNQFDYPPVRAIRLTKRMFNELPLNINLHKNPFPFNQYDYQPVHTVPQARVETNQSLNIELFRNPYPFNQSDYSKPYFPVVRPYPQDGLNLNLFKNPIPFYNDDPSQVRGFKLQAFFEAPYNQNLFSITVVQQPFVQTDWTPVKKPPTTTAPEATFNPNLFTNPYPFYNDDPSRVRGFKPLAFFEAPYNQNLFSVVVVQNPFVQTDWTPVKKPPVTTAPEATFNLNLFTNPFPFNQSDFQPAHTVPQARAELHQALNINLFLNPYPFNQYDFQPAHTVPQARLEPNQSLNINVYANRYPFNQYDYNKPYFPVVRPYPQDGININLFTNPIPFNQYDYNKPYFPVVRPYPQDGININLFTNPVPFYNDDPSRVKGFYSNAFFESPYNQNLFFIPVVQAPFVQTDWTPVKKPPTTTSPEATFNPNLFANPVPFNQFDYPPVHKVAQAPFDLSVATNLQLFVNIVPFYNAHFVPVKQPWPTLQDQSTGFQLILQPPPSGPGEHHDIPFFSTVGMLTSR